MAGQGAYHDKFYEASRHTRKGWPERGHIRRVSSSCEQRRGPREETTPTMRIAFITSQTSGDADLVLYRLAERLAAQGLRLAGTVQINTERRDGAACDMDLMILPKGPTIRISQFRGLGSRGCRLDTRALEDAVGLCENRLDQGADVLIINKFGKHEAEGRGFRSTIAKALGQGMPVLVGLNGLNRVAFDEFVDGVGQRLKPEVSALEDWVLAAMAHA